MRKSITSILLLLISFSVSAQTEEAQKAYQFYREKNYEEAREYINKAIKTSAGEKDAINWHIRGFIYKDIFATGEDKKENENARTEAIKSLKKSVELDEFNTLDEMNFKVLRHLATTYYNDAVHIMRGVNKNTIDQSLDQYNKYKEIISFISPNEKFKEMDVSFYLALSTVYRKIYETDRDNLKAYWEKSNEYLSLVLDIDPSSEAAYFNLGVNHYNKGADEIVHMPAEIEIPEMSIIQERSSKSFEESLPYILKAYELDPERIEVLKALRGIYISLNDEEKAIFYDDKLKEKLKEE